MQTQKLVLNLSNGFGDNYPKTKTITEFKDLPEEILYQIFNFLDEDSLLKARLVNKAWKRVSEGSPLFYNFTINRIIEIAWQVGVFQYTLIKMQIPTVQRNRLSPTEINFSLKYSDFFAHYLRSGKSQNILENVFYLFNSIIKKKNRSLKFSQSALEIYFQFIALKKNLEIQIKDFNINQIDMNDLKSYTQNKKKLNKIFFQFSPFYLITLAREKPEKFSLFVPAVLKKIKKITNPNDLFYANSVQLSLFFNRLKHTPGLLNNTEFACLKNAICFNHAFEEPIEHKMSSIEDDKVPEIKENALWEVIENVDIVNFFKNDQIDIFNKRKRVVDTFLPFLSLNQNNEYDFYAYKSVTNFLLRSTDIELKQEELFQYVKDLFGRNDYLAFSILQAPKLTGIIKNLSEPDKNDMRLMMRNVACDTGYSLAFEKFAKLSDLFNEADVIEILNINLNANYEGEIKTFFENKIRQYYEHLKYRINKGHPVNAEIFRLTILCLLPSLYGNGLAGVLTTLNYKGGSALDLNQKFEIFKKVAKLYGIETIKHCDWMADEQKIELLQVLMENILNAKTIRIRINNNKIKFQNLESKTFILNEIKKILPLKREQPSPETPENEEQKVESNEPK